MVLNHRLVLRGTLVVHPDPFSSAAMHFVVVVVTFDENRLSHLIMDFSEFLLVFHMQVSVILDYS